MTPAVSPPSFHCPHCQGLIIFGAIPTCNSCGAVVEYEQGIPILLRDKSIQQGRGKAALAESIFQQSHGYYVFVTAKRWLFRDAMIGANEFTTGRDVLDVGCGPSLTLGHLEYDPRACRTLTAVDVSLPFVLSARSAYPESRYSFAVASIDNLPFTDKAFDTTVVSFVLHHLPFDLRVVMTEVARVTRRTIVIYDHLRADSEWKSALQCAYWRIMDGGDQYLTRRQWSETLQEVQVYRELKTGALFGHVIKFICTVPAATSSGARPSC